MVSQSALDTRYSPATRKTNFPKFSPLKSMSGVSENVSIPTTMRSFDFIFPSYKYPAISAIAMP